MANMFFDIGIIVIIASVVGFFARLLKQPVIPAYILTGLLIGPFGIGLVTDIETIKTLSEIGIAFLLFVVGLELDFRKLRNIGMIASVGGTIKTAILFVLGLIIAGFLGFTQREGIYIGLIIAFSSTMVVIKILSDKRELDTLHGRIIIGILLMEDILAILALSSLSTLGTTPILLIFAILKGLSIFVFAILASRYFFPSVFKIAAKSQEMLFLMAITVCFFFALLSSYLGFSIIIGAFVAGVALGNLPYNLEIVGRIKPLRDFFATIFFVSLGMELAVNNMNGLVAPLLIMTGIIVILKPIIVMSLGRLFRYTKRTSFLTAISLAQISEFSLIIVAQGLALGHISQDIFSLTVLLAIITISITSYFIKFDNQIYKFLSKPLGIFEPKKSKKELEYLPQTEYDVILVGYDRIGYSISKTLKKIGKQMMVVDFNPDLIRKLIKEKIPCLYGDIGDIDIIERLDFRKVDIVISTVPNEEENILLIKKLKEVNHKASIFVTAYHVDEALNLYDIGADYVILPHFLGGDHVSLMLEDVTGDINKLVTTKVKHIEELKERKELGHEHPKQNHQHKER
ncbi:cation:proton antiporter [Candidatus Woesearchaeota archaeon]|nr:cation:proton antiporter [Candidatus Woesearchaeota archaeon]